MTAEVSRLRNGLTVVTVPGPASATAMIFVGAGSRYESRPVAGIAHFLEHLFFKGTPTRPSHLLIASELDSLGAIFNAVTSKEFTAYFVKCAAEYVGRGLDVLADMLRHALLDPAEIDRERGVIMQELRRSQDAPARRAGRLASEVLFGDTPLGWDTIGFEDVIAGATRDDFASYRATFYAPGRMTLAVAGPVAHEAARALAERHFGDLEPRPLPPPAPAVYADRQFAGERRDLQQTTLRLVLPGPGIQDGERENLALSLATTVLGGSMSSRLFISVRERQGLCYNIGASSSAYADAGMIAVSTGVDGDRAAQAISAIEAEIERLLQEGPTEDELAKVKAMSKSRFTIAREDSGFVARTAALDLLNYGRVREQEDVFALLDGLAADDLLAAFRRWYDVPALRLAVVGPAAATLEPAPA